MDITPTTTITNVNATTTTTPNTLTSATKSPEPDSETPTRIHNPTTTTTTKTLPFSNGLLKRHHPHHHHHPHPHHHHLATNHPVAVTYKECQKNHAASLGGHALDGCGEFMPSPNATSTDPSSIKCAACGCHRNFHRREPEEPISTTHVIEYQPHHRHHPLPPFQASNRSPNSTSPPPISSSYYPSAPHVLLALSAGLAAPPESTAAPTNALASPSPNARKRFRTKFTQDQKEKMQRFAESVGWKMQKRDEDLVHDFCNDVGVDRGVLKVWMHNNKNTLAKRDANGGGSRNILEEEPNITHNAEINGNDNENNQNDSAEDPSHYQNDSGANVVANGSSSSS